MLHFDKDHCPTYLWEDSNHGFLWLSNKGQKISDDKGHSHGARELERVQAKLG